MRREGFVSLAYCVGRLTKTLSPQIKGYERVQVPWTSFVHTQTFKDPNEGPSEVYANDRYVVIKTTSQPTDPTFVPLVHLSIRRTDRTAIHDWRDLQRIKNELVGPACEGVESGSSIVLTSSICGCLLRRRFGSLLAFKSDSSPKAPIATVPGNDYGSLEVAR